MNKKRMWNTIVGGIFVVLLLQICAPPVENTPPQGGTATPSSTAAPLDRETMYALCVDKVGATLRHGPLSTAQVLIYADGSGGVVQGYHIENGERKRYRCDVTVKNTVDTIRVIDVQWRYTS